MAKTTIKLHGIIVAKGQPKKASAKTAKDISYFYAKAGEKAIFARLAGKCIELKTVHKGIINKYILLPADKIFKRVVKVGNNNMLIEFSKKQIVAEISYTDGGE